MSDGLKALPEVNFCETDGANVEQSVINAYEVVAGVNLAAGDPVRLFLESLALVIVTQRQAINLTGKRNLLAYSDGDYLDHQGAWTMTPRLDPYPAIASIRFELNEALESVVNIPAGTRITPDNKLMFATDNGAEIPAGDLSVEVAATCQTVGTIGNGFLAGQLNRLVDPVPGLIGVVKVANTGVTLGGAEVEDDERYRERIQLSPEKLSVAGPEGAYIFFAKSTHQDIADVKVESPSEGKVDIIVLMKDGELPSQEILDAVNSICTPKKKRPLTDHVTALAPVPVNYDIDLKWWIGSSNAVLAATIQERVSKAISDFIAWQRSALGRDINPTKLSSVIEQAGAKRVEITNPVHTPLTPWQVAKLSEEGPSVLYGGLEND